MPEDRGWMCSGCFDGHTGYFCEDKEGCHKDHPGNTNMPGTPCDNGAVCISCVARWEWGLEENVGMYFLTHIRDH